MLQKKRIWTALRLICAVRGCLASEHERRCGQWSLLPALTLVVPWSGHERAEHWIMQQACCKHRYKQPQCTLNLGVPVVFCTLATQARCFSTYKWVGLR